MVAPNTVDARAALDAFRELQRQAARIAKIVGRPVPLDGHTVGAVGEAWAAHLFALTLLPASARDHDAIAPDGTKVQIKATVDGDAVGFSGDVAPERLVVLRLGFEGDPEVVYDGPGAEAWDLRGNRNARNGQCSVRFTALRALQARLQLRASGTGT